jgi:hypothetical protein
VNAKGLIWGGMIVGSTAGGFLPLLWNGGLLSYTLWTAVGGFGGIYVAYKFAKATGAL